MSTLSYRCLTLGDLETNCYLVWDENTHHCVVIDPADSGEFINGTILELQLEPQAIWLTHGHFDHVLGLLEVATAFTLPIWLHADDHFLLKQAAANAKHWLKRTVDPIPAATNQWQDEQQLKLGNHTFEVMHTPGHTPGSVSLYAVGQNVLFSGDTLFQGTIGRTDFAYSNRSSMADSLKKLLTLPNETVVLAGHGPSTIIEHERSAR